MYSLLPFLFYKQAEIDLRCCVTALPRSLLCNLGVPELGDASLALACRFLRDFRPLITRKDEVRDFPTQPIYVCSSLGSALRSQAEEAWTRSCPSACPAKGVSCGTSIQMTYLTLKCHDDERYRKRRHTLEDSVCKPATQNLPGRAGTSVTEFLLCKSFA